MKMYKLSLGGTLLLLSGMFILSCKKTEHIEAKYLETYLQTERFQTDDALPRIDFIVKANKSTINTTLSIPNPVRLTTAATADITVQLGVDSSLVDSFNKANHTAYKKVAEGSYKFSAETLTIRAGMLKPDIDSLQISIIKPDTTLFGVGNTYLLPIRLKEVNGTGVGMAASVVYIKIKSRIIKSSISLEKSSANLLGMTYYYRPRSGIYMPTLDSGKVIFHLDNPVKIPVISQVVSGNNAAVEAYNKANGTDYKLLPADSYTLTNEGNITIKQDSTHATMGVKFKNFEHLGNTNKYLLPLVLKQGETAFIEKGSDMVYFTLAPSIQNLDPTNPVLSEPVLDRTGWSVTASGHYSDYKISNILDGHNETAWDSDGNMPAWVILDMGKENLVKGFSIVPNYAYSTEDIREMEIYTSKDGLNWEAEGKYIGTETKSGSSASKPDIKNIRFYDAVKARYFKFVIIASSAGQYTGMSELNAK